jgi:hypothetical protein
MRRAQLASQKIIDAVAYTLSLLIERCPNIWRDHRSARRKLSAGLAAVSCHSAAAMRI